jgi:tetratricopeptide (TPR) repeat protein
VREFRYALDSLPDDPRVLFNLAQAEQARGYLAEAAGLLLRVTEIWPSHGRVHYQAGLCARDRGLLTDAEASLVQAIECDADLLRARYVLAHLRAERGERSRALRDLAEVLKRQEDYGPAHYALGRLLVADAPAKAQFHFHEALLGQPPVIRAHLDLGRLLEDCGRLRRARAEYVLFARHFPDERPAWIEARLAWLDAELTAEAAS